MPRFTSDLVAEQRDPDADDTNVVPLWKRKRDTFNLNDVIAEARAAFAGIGLVAPAEIVADGRFHRVAVAGGRQPNDAGSYKMYEDGWPTLILHNWREGTELVWHPDNAGREISKADRTEADRRIAAAKAEQKAERDKAAAEAGERADIMWDKGRIIEADGHPYLVRKDIKPHGVRGQERANNLLVPMYDEVGALCNLQRIDCDGNKRYLFGGIKKGCSYTIGELLGEPETITIAEGFSTGASAHQATGYPVVIAFDAGNLLPVAEAVRAKYPNAHLVFLADDDREAELKKEAETGETDGNTGLVKARAAAERVGGWVALPQFGPGRTDKQSDFNNLAHVVPLDAVKRQIEAAVPWQKAPTRSAEIEAALRGEAPEGGAEGEILPSFDEVKQAATELITESDAATIKAVIESIAAGRFSAIEDDQLLDIVKAQTPAKLPALKSMLKDAKRSIAGPPRQRSGNEIRGAVGNALLILDNNDDPKPLTANVVTVLTNSPPWRDVLWLDELTGFITLRRPPSWHDENREFKERPWKDSDTRIATVWMQQFGIHAPSHIVFEGIKTAAELNPFHPIRDYLDPLPWDENDASLIDDFFPRYFGAGGEPPDEADGKEAMNEWRRRYAYYQAVGARFLIGAVAGIYEPGCKNDCMPSLVGEQGTLKSSALRAMFDPWFTDEISDLGSKDAAMQAAGVWCIEIGELAAMRRTHVEAVKAWLSRSKDRFRPPYGHTVIEQPRQSVAAGTTNADTFLTDETGNRRVWSIRCGEIDLKALKADRDRLWAEAAHRYRKGERYWLHEPALIAIAAEVQAEFMEEEVHEEGIRLYLETVSSTTADEVLAHIGILIADRTKAQANSVTRVLRKAGWVRKQATADKPADKHVKRYRPWRWYPPEPAADGTTTK
jgi:predicted P-loop ATPase/phage/plasmid primase-like uncharacterized protein